MRFKEGDKVIICKKGLSVDKGTIITLGKEVHENWYEFWTEEDGKFSGRQISTEYFRKLTKLEKAMK